MKIAEKLFGTHSDRELKIVNPIVDKIEAMRDSMMALSDEELRDKTKEYKKRLEEGETLDDLLPEAFATVREAARRVLGMEHYRVQLMGGVVLHQGRIAEMKTGEGKTLVSTLPAYLNALEGKGVHVITVNDYLAKRDAEWMGKIYTFLGLSVGCVIHGISDKTRKAAYRADITYGTNNEFGFDYLRDNMVIYQDQLTQRDLNYAIIDEVDSILIDEARTPLIISGQGDESTDLYRIANKFVNTLYEGENADYTIEEKEKRVSLTDQGVSKAEQFFKIENFGDPENMEINHHVVEALKAKAIMKRDVDYVVDAIDTISARLKLAELAPNYSFKLISSMGGANKIHPECFKIADLYDTVNCPLCRIMRKEGRKRGIKQLKVIYSCEQPVDTNMGSDWERVERKDLGTASFVPPIFGQMIAGEVLRDLAGRLSPFLPSLP